MTQTQETKKNLSEEAINKLRGICEHIMEEPRRLDMSLWYHDHRNNLDYDSMDDSLPPCGTTGCIAGWLVQLYGDEGDKREMRHRSASPAARAIIGIEIDVGSRLFHVYNWPEKFKRDHNEADTALDQAKVTVARIEHFIETDGKE